MASNFSFHFCLSANQKLNVYQNCFVIIKVNWIDGGMHEEEFSIASIAKKMRKRTGAYNHVEDISLPLEEIKEFDNLNPLEKNEFSQNLEFENKKE